MSTEADIPPESPPDPHGIDQDREQRLAKIFIGLIGVAFLLVLVMLGGAFAWETVYGEEPEVSPPPAWDPETPEKPALPGSHP